MRFHAAVAVAGLMIVASGGCAGWRRTQIADGERLSPRQQVQVWRAGGHQVVHGARVTHDTLYAVPFTMAPGCDSCRLAFPLSEVDSLRLGHQERQGLLIALLPVAALGGLLLAFAIGYGAD